MQQLVAGQGIYPQQRLFFRDQAFPHHFHSHPHSSSCSALAASGLQHVEFALLDGELNVLHIPVVIFQLVEDLCKLFLYTSGIFLSVWRWGWGVRIPATTSSPWASVGTRRSRRSRLWTDQGKGNASTAVLAHVSKDHGLRVHCVPQSPGISLILR